MGPSLAEHLPKTDPKYPAGSDAFRLRWRNENESEFPAEDERMLSLRDVPNP